MFNFIIKSTLYFSISFTLLSVNMGGKPLFTHLNMVAAPYTGQIINDSLQQMERGMRRGKKFLKQLFFNSVPREVRNISKQNETLVTWNKE